MNTRENRRSGTQSNKGKDTFLDSLEDLKSDTELYFKQQKLSELPPSRFKEFFIDIHKNIEDSNDTLPEFLKISEGGFQEKLSNDFIKLIRNKNDFTDFVQSLKEADIDKNVLFDKMSKEILEEFSLFDKDAKNTLQARENLLELAKHSMINCALKVFGATISSKNETKDLYNLNGKELQELFNNISSLDIHRTRHIKREKSKTISRDALKNMPSQG